MAYIVGKTSINGIQWDYWHAGDNRKFRTEQGNNGFKEFSSLEEMIKEMNSFGISHPWEKNNSLKRRKDD